MKAMDFSNVRLSDEVLKDLQKRNESVSSAKPHLQLEPVIATMALTQPLWTFTGSGMPTAMIHFQVRCDGEFLGTIERRYAGREYQICITNDRIKASMERDIWYKTMSATKAVAKIKKTFSPKTTSESAEKAREIASKTAQKADWEKSREKGEAFEVVQKAAREYVMGVGFNTFMEHMRTHLPAQEYELLVSKHETAKVAAQELETINATRGVVVGTVPGAVVTQRGDGTYLIDHTRKEGGDTLEICSDNTPPEWVRDRIGLLKLIEPGQFVSDMGMRADQNIFVIIKPLTTVTEGEMK